MGALDDYITNAAIQRGIDPNIALRVYQSEGGNGYTGDAGTSFGPFQLHYGTGGRGFAQAGMGNDFTAQTGLNARNPSTVNQQVDFALDYAKQHGWGPWYGAKRAGITGMMGIGPSNWQVASNAGAKGDSLASHLLNSAAPQQASTGAQASMADNTQDNSGGALGNLTKGGYDWSALGPALMALGGGIAAGGAPGGGGWGAGLGQGLNNATNVMQTRLGNQFKLAELMNTLRHQGIEEDIATANSQREGETVQRGQSGALALLGQTAPKFEDAASVLSGNVGGEKRYSPLGQLLTTGKTGEAVDTLKQMVNGAYRLMGQEAKPEDYSQFIPQVYDKDPTVIANKLNSARQLVYNAYQFASAGKDAAWHKQYDPIFSKFATELKPGSTTTTGAGTTASKGGGTMNASTVPSNVQVYKNPKTGERGYVDPGTGKWTQIQ